jgi:hypothetical protein
MMPLTLPKSTALQVWMLIFVRSFFVPYFISRERHSTDHLLQLGAKVN